MERFTLMLPQAGSFTQAYSATGQPVRLKSLEDGSLEVSFPLHVAEALVLILQRWVKVGARRNPLTLFCLQKTGPSRCSRAASRT